MPYADATLSDVYTQSTGEVFISGIQALVRLPLIQIARDRRAGLNTAGLSPAIAARRWAARPSNCNAPMHLDATGVVFKPGDQRGAGRDRVWGTQQLQLSPGRQVRRRLRHLVRQGTGRRPHRRRASSTPMPRAPRTWRRARAWPATTTRAKSSTLPHQSDHAFMSAIIPVLYPSGVHEFVGMGLLGIAMSRYSGCWVAMKVIADTVESSASIDLADEHDRFVTAERFPAAAAAGSICAGPMTAGRRITGCRTTKCYAALAFGRANNIDRIIIDPPRARFGIAASGKAYVDVREALALTRHRRARRGADRPRLLQGRHALAARAGARSASFRRGLRGDPGRRRTAPDGGEPDEGSISTTGSPMRSARASSASSTRTTSACLPLDMSCCRIIADVLAGDHRWSGSRCRRDLRACDQRQSASDRASTQGGSTLQARRADAHAVLLLRLPAQHLDPRARRQPRAGRHRLPLHGAVDEPQHRDLHPDGRRRRAVDRPCAVHRREARLRQSRRRHLFPLAASSRSAQAVAAGANITYKILFNDAVAMTGGQPVDGR